MYTLSFPVFSNTVTLCPPHIKAAVCLSGVGIMWSRVWFFFTDSSKDKKRNCLWISTMARWIYFAAAKPHTKQH